MILQHLTLTIKSFVHSICNLQTRNMLSLSLIVIITVLSQASSSQTNGLTCPEGWEALYGKCYLIVTRQSGSGLSWSLAQQDCHANGGKLALPLDKTENDGIFDLYTQRESKFSRFWIGAVALDKGDPLKFTTREGQKLNFTNWKPGQPNQPNPLSCAYVGNFGAPAQWADDICQFDKADYVCERMSEGLVKGDCPFEDNVLFVENSIQKESIEDCQEFCQEIDNCEVSIIGVFENHRKSHIQCDIFSTFQTLLIIPILNSEFFCSVFHLE